MARIVMKFGGTSVGDVDRIKNVARLVKAEQERGNEVAVVVSAMSGKTNELVGYCREISELYDQAEYDVVVSSGEQITVGLLAMALKAIGVKARSWLAWQLPFGSDSAHGNAKITEIQTDEILASMEAGNVAVVAGFQGVSPEGRVSTLGRGGSDTSAVALAAAMNADRCDIYTDVDGIYTTDPRVVPTARKLDKISFEEMLELASVGAKVLQTRAVSMAMRYKTRLQVLSSFEEKPGTLVCDEDEIMEQTLVSGIAFTRDEAKVTLVDIPDRPGVAALVFSALADAAINVDMIVQARSDSREKTNMSFTISEIDLERTKMMLAERAEAIGYADIITDSKVAKVSIVGLGMRSNAGIASQMFSALSEKGINIQLITTSEIKVSVLIGEDYLELATRHLHNIYKLDQAA
ncbi:MAG: aspartate kinase [Alphaproteobacteria bacterium]